MRLSNYYIQTQKDTPVEAEVVSHQLMLRGGFIKQLSSGIYSWLPIGLKVYQKVEAIVREEMNKMGAMEVDLPNTQPAELWQESGRWKDYGPELLRFKDRHQRDFCLGPTHEEVITDVVKGEVKSYKQLPLCFYQIEKKFRDEVRPRFGIMRGREFVMKDAYSFHLNQASLQETYDKMYHAYSQIFDRIGLDYRAVLADNGSIGGTGSHEFHVLAETGEDYIAFAPASGFASNIEMAECLLPKTAYYPSAETLEKVHTPNCKTIQAIADFLQLDIKKTAKTMVVESEVEGELVALCLRGDHRLNEIKAEKISGIKQPLTMANPERIKEVLGCGIGSIGPKNFTGRIIADRAAFVEQSLCVGANVDDYHYIGFNWGRDAVNVEVFDIRDIEAGDPSPDGQGEVEICKGIEVGHIFQLGNKYSESLNLTVLDEQGKAVNPLMGCYGIGVTRIVAAAIEQNHDDNGMLFPLAIAPFEVVIAPIGYDKSARVKTVADALYQTLLSQGVDVCLDNRGKRPGVMFAELELLGIPHRIVIGDKTLADNEIEYKAREANETIRVSVESVLSYLEEKLLA